MINPWLTLATDLLLASSKNQDLCPLACSGIQT